MTRLPSDPTPTPQPPPPCACWACQRDRAPDPLIVGMVVCERCGNKRCPHATHHSHPCTASNAPGQPGSRYPASTADLTHPGYP